MARMAYDESGGMALYFVLTFLAVVLVPLTLSLSGGQRKVKNGCTCTACLEQRARIKKRENGAAFLPHIGLKHVSVVGGWALFAYIAYKVANSSGGGSIYNPFEILGLSEAATDKEIKSWFKKLSKQYHPDKVKMTGNQTAESVAAKFVEITKAYKSLTDEVTRENWLKYNNPDGPQQTEMGIALPPWIIEAQNNIWVLGVYGLMFGIALPALVGRWWFGNRAQTKDGVDASTAASFFRALKEESDMATVVGALGQAAEWNSKTASKRQQQIDALEEQVSSKLGDNWMELCRLAGANGQAHPGRRQALVLLYAHLLRLPITDASLQKEQTRVVLQIPSLLNALLSITLARSWLIPTLTAMRLHAYLAQALVPRNMAKKELEIGQLPKVDAAEPTTDVKSMSEFATKLEENGDARASEVNKALAKWPRLDLVSADFKVIDERIVTPAAIVYLVVKLRLTPPTSSSANAEKEESVDTADTVKQRLREEEAKDYAFLTSKAESEEGFGDDAVGWAHAPLWPANRKPSWWLVLGDDKTNRVVVPPVKITDVPFSDASKTRNYRSYKLQFQAPPQAAVFTWKIYLVSDTFVGEEIEHNVTLTIDDPAALTTEERGNEDEISDPEEDSLAGQMAALRGGSVKRVTADGESDEDESGTDDDEESGSGSSSDSDSD